MTTSSAADFRDKPTTILAVDDSPDKLRLLSGLLKDQYRTKLCSDFITKPINPPIGLARVATQRQAMAGADLLRNQSHFLESEVQRRAREITAIQDVTILAMASLAQTRDNETGTHIRRTQNYVRALAHALREHPRLRDQLSAQDLALAKGASSLAN